jgi:hypothetical protein
VKPSLQDGKTTCRFTERAARPLGRVSKRLHDWNYQLHAVRSGPCFDQGKETASTPLRHRLSKAWNAIRLARFS